MKAMLPHGIKVRLVTCYTEQPLMVLILRNVTEIHYKHGAGDSCAFESAIHSCGLDVPLVFLTEFETLGIETGKAESFEL